MYMFTFQDHHSLLLHTLCSSQ